MEFNPGGGGGEGGGYSGYILVGCALAHTKIGVLGAGTLPKGELRWGHSPKKGVLGTYLFIIFTFVCRNDQLKGGHGSGRLNNGGLRCGNSPKRGG